MQITPKVIATKKFRELPRKKKQKKPKKPVTPQKKNQENPSKTQENPPKNLKKQKSAKKLLFRLRRPKSKGGDQKVAQVGGGSLFWSTGGGGQL